MQPIKTSHGIALLTACLFASLLFINWASKQIDLISLSIPSSSQTAQVISTLSDRLVAHYTFDDNANDSACCI